MKSNITTENNYNETIKKIIDLSLTFLNKESKCWIDIMCTKIKFCELQKQYLLENKPLFFQKKKLEEYNIKIKDIDDKIMKILSDIEEEISFSEKSDILLTSK